MNAVVIEKILIWFSDNWFNLLSIIALAVGGVFALIQWNKSVKLRRAEFINQIIEKLRFDKNMASTMYLIDYDEEWYTEEFHDSEEMQFAIDKMFSYLSYICYLIDIRHITKKESSILGYELRRACESYQVQAYLYNLYHFSQNRYSRRKKDPCSFQYLIDYGLKEAIIDREDFMNESSTRYPHYLNF